MQTITTLGKATTTNDAAKNSSNTPKITLYPYPKNIPTSCIFQNLIFLKKDVIIYI